MKHGSHHKARDDTARADAQADARVKAQAAARAEAQAAAQAEAQAAARAEAQAAARAEEEAAARAEEEAAARAAARARSAGAARAKERVRAEAATRAEAEAAAAEAEAEAEERIAKARAAQARASAALRSYAEAQGSTRPAPAPSRAVPLSSPYVRSRTPLRIPTNSAQHSSRRASSEASSAESERPWVTCKTSNSKVTRGQERDAAASRPAQVAKPKMSSESTKGVVKDTNQESNANRIHSYFNPPQLHKQQTREEFRPGSTQISQAHTGQKDIRVQKKKIEVEVVYHNRVKAREYYYHHA